MNRADTHWRPKCAQKRDVQPDTPKRVGGSRPVAQPAGCMTSTTRLICPLGDSELTVEPAARPENSSRTTSV